MKVLVIVDMQNDFITGSLGSKAARDIIPLACNKIATFEGKMIATFDTHQKDYLHTFEGKKLPVAHCVQKTWGWYADEYISQVAGDADYVLKNTFGYLNWKHILPIEDEIDCIEIIGLCTDVCVVSNALILRACFPNTPIIVWSNLCAGTSEEAHEAALKTMQSCQIEVKKWEI